MFKYLATVLAIVAYAECFPTGAPRSACVTMIPGHGVDPQNSPPPYIITTDSETVKAGAPLLVTVSGETPANLIRGIMLQARDGDKIVGTFEVDPKDPISRPMKCDVQDDTVTHKFHDDKDDQHTVTYKWIAPAGLDEEIKFRATIVVSFEKFWVGVESAPVKVYP